MLRNGVEWKSTRMYRNVEVVIDRTLWLPPSSASPFNPLIYFLQKKGINHLVPPPHFRSPIPTPREVFFFNPLWMNCLGLLTNWLFCPVLLRRGRQRWWRRAREAARAGRGRIPGFARNWPLQVVQRANGIWIHLHDKPRGKPLGYSSRCICTPSKPDCGVSVFVFVCFLLPVFTFFSVEELTGSFVNWLKITWPSKSSLKSRVIAVFRVCAWALSCVSFPKQKMKSLKFQFWVLVDWRNFPSSLHSEIVVV